jgi:signal transduction histidine kinase
LCERFESLAGGDVETVTAGERIIRLKAAEPVRIVGASLISPDLIYVAVTRWIGPYFFRSLEWDVERVAAGHVVVTIEQPDPVSAAWFRMAEGSFIRLPEAVGSSPAHVTAHIEGNRGRFDIRCAAGTTLWARTVARFRTAFSTASLLDELSVMQFDLREALTEANSSQREMRRALSAVPDPVAILRENTLLWRNEAWGKALGEHVPAQVKHAVSQGVTALLEDVQTDDKLILEVVPPVRIIYEQRPALLVLLRDVTQTRQAAERMRVADRLAALGTLAASIGHEINNPLQVALGSLELAEHEPGDNPGQYSSREQLNMAIDAIERAAAITADLLSFGRDETAIEDVDINTVLRTALRLAGNELRHIGHIDVTLDPALPRVAGASGRLTQVFVNLLVNAAQAMRERPGVDHRIAICTKERMGEVIIQIEDTGLGIPGDLLLKIREPFFTTKGQEGSGLGLAICERIVGEHGGALEITNRSEGGARVEIHLPASTNHAYSAQPKTEDPSRDVGELRLLVVDDEKAIADMLRLLLEPHDVVICNDAAQALAAIGENPRFDAILLDVMLMDRSGLEIRNELPEQLRERVIFMTGGVFEPELQSALKALPNPLLSKPFSRSSVLEAVEKIARDT